MIGRLPDLSSGGASGRPSGVSGRDLSANVGETTVEIGRRKFEAGDTWQSSTDRMLGCASDLVDLRVRSSLDR